MTNVTRDLVEDLLPVYLAGDASADTRRVVEAFLAGDPELAREVEEARSGPIALPATPPPSTGEKQALDATRQLLKHRTSTMAVAILFTLLPFSFAVEDSHLKFLLFRDAPTIAIAWWATAAVMWVWHFRIRARVRVSGL
jgi:anti-sigma factor RsiW